MRTEDARLDLVFAVSSFFDSGFWSLTELARLRIGGYHSRPTLFKIRSVCHVYSATIRGNDQWQFTRNLPGSRDL